MQTSVFVLIIHIHRHRKTIREISVRQSLYLCNSATFFMYTGTEKPLGRYRYNKTNNWFPIVLIQHDIKYIN